MRFYTQIELTSPTGEQEVWWIPVPEGRAKAGEKITKDGIDWTITAVCITLPEDSVPMAARKAAGFHREAQTIAYMSL